MGKYYDNVNYISVVLFKRESNLLHINDASLKDYYQQKLQ